MNRTLSKTLRKLLMALMAIGLLGLPVLAQDDAEEPESPVEVPAPAPEDPAEDEPAQEEPAQEESETVKKIKTILEDYIKPAVEQDGGAITFHSYRDKIVKVRLQGSCSGCPSSMVTLKAGIENLFKRMMPDEVQSVEALG